MPDHAVFLAALKAAKGFSGRWMSDQAASTALHATQPFHLLGLVGWVPPSGGDWWFCPFSTLGLLTDADTPRAMMPSDRLPDDIPVPRFGLRALALPRPVPLHRVMASHFQAAGWTGYGFTLAGWPGHLGRTTSKKLPADCRRCSSARCFTAGADSARWSQYRPAYKWRITVSGLRRSVSGVPSVLAMSAVARVVGGRAISYCGPMWYYRA